MSNLYNMIKGVNQEAFFILPMLGKHPDEYPRFRDCFVDGRINILTRTGGGNRESYEADNQAMREMPGFVTDYDDSFDPTFAVWVFDVPERWKADFDKLEAGNVQDVSAEYQAEIRRVYPKLAETWDKLFPSAEAEAEAEAKAKALDKQKLQQYFDKLLDAPAPLLKTSAPLLETSAAADFWDSFCDQLCDLVTASEKKLEEV